MQVQLGKPVTESPKKLEANIDTQLKNMKSSYIYKIKRVEEIYKEKLE